MDFVCFFVSRLGGDEDGINHGAASENAVGHMAKRKAEIEPSVAEGSCIPLFSLNSLYLKISSLFVPYFNSRMIVSLLRH